MYVCFKLSALRASVDGLVVLRLVVWGSGLLTEKWNEPVFPLYIHDGRITFFHKKNT